MAIDGTGGKAAIGGTGGEAVIGGMDSSGTGGKTASGGMDSDGGDIGKADSYGAGGKAVVNGADDKFAIAGAGFDEAAISGTGIDIATTCHTDTSVDVAPYELSTRQGSAVPQGLPTSSRGSAVTQGLPISSRGAAAPQGLSVPHEPSGSSGSSGLYGSSELHIREPLSSRLSHFQHEPSRSHEPSKSSVQQSPYSRPSQPQREPSELRGLPRLNFPAFDFRVARDREGLLIRDDLRHTWLRLTPEEWVRQHLLRYLIGECGAPPAMVRQECPIILGGMRQRADVVVYGPDGRALLLSECKAPAVTVGADVFAQAVRYNSVVGARYVAVTNGLRHFVRELMPDGSYKALGGFPKLG